MQAEIAAAAPTAASVAAQFPGATTVPAGWNTPPAPNGYPTPPQQPAAQQPGVPAQSCVHGQMQYREAKPGSGKSWKGWFCPTPKGTAGQCPPQFSN